MKRHSPFVLLLIATLFTSITFLAAQSAATLTKIKQVENGLSNYHQIKGEPTWTIAEMI